jgi:CheY-like chemotaxis protein
MLDNMVVLCIDDDSDDVAFFCDAIGTIDTSYTCIAAPNGKDGLNILTDVRPDYIFLDINMPVMNGKETLKVIRQNSCLRNIPVYMLSTTSNPAELKRYKELGATDCLVKPNRFEDLCDLLAPILRS